MNKDDFKKLTLKSTPIHYQYINQKHLGREFICKVNFDGVVQL